MGLKPRIAPIRQTEPIIEEDPIDVEGLTTFLTVDLDLETPNGDDALSTLVEALGSVFELHRTTAPHRTHLELSTDRELDMIETFDGLLSLIEGLPTEARAEWDQCTQRRFDIGIQAGLKPAATHYALDADLMTRLVRCGADVAITVYGAEIDSVHHSANQ